MMIHAAFPAPRRAFDIMDRGKPELCGRGTQIVPNCLPARVHPVEACKMAFDAQEYKNNAATCWRLSKTMDDDNRRRLEDIGRRWLELAKEGELDGQEYLEAAE
jgi:hypothetical protein